MQTVSEVREWLDQVPPPRSPALEEFTGIVKAFHDAKQSEDRRSSLRAALKYFSIARSRKFGTEAKKAALLDEVRAAIVRKGNTMRQKRPLPNAATNERPAAKARADHNPHKRDLQSPGDAEQVANSSHSNEDQPPKKVRTQLTLRTAFFMHTPNSLHVVPDHTSSNQSWKTKMVAFYNEARKYKQQTRFSSHEAHEFDRCFDFFKLLQEVPCSYRQLQLKALQSLYSPVAGPLRTSFSPRSMLNTNSNNKEIQDLSFLSYVACAVAMGSLSSFLRNQPSLQDSPFPQLQWCQSLHSCTAWPASSTSPTRMIQALNHTTSVIPFGHSIVQDDVLGCPFFYFWRHLACLEMPLRKFDTLPFAHSELVQMVADHRRRATVDIPVPTIHDVKNALQSFLDNSWSIHCHKRWVCKILNVKQYNIHDGEYWQSIVDNIVLPCAIQNIPNVSKVLKRLTRYHGFQLFDLLANIRNV